MSFALTQQNLLTTVRTPKLPYSPPAMDANARSLFIFDTTSTANADIGVLDTAKNGALGTTTISGGVVTAINFTKQVAAAIYYNGAPTPVISAPPAGGTQATATLSMAADGTLSVQTLNGGSGYTAAPTITFPVPIKDAYVFAGRGDLYDVNNPAHLNFGVAVASQNNGKATVRTLRLQGAKNIIMRGCHIKRADDTPGNLIAYVPTLATDSTGYLTGTAISVTGISTTAGAPKFQIGELIKNTAGVAARFLGLHVLAATPSTGRLIYDGSCNLLSNIVGTFTPGETVTSGTTSAKLCGATADRFVYTDRVGSAFTVGATLTGATSGATGTIGATAATTLASTTTVTGAVSNATLTPGAAFAFPADLFYIRLNTGEVFLEGVYIDANFQCGVDAIRTGGTKITMQNVYATNTHSVVSGLHADVLQPTDPITDLTASGGYRFYNVTMVGGYQGIQIQAEFDLGVLAIDNFNVRYLDPDFSVLHTEYYPFTNGTFYSQPHQGAISGTMPSGTPGLPGCVGYSFWQGNTWAAYPFYANYKYGGRVYAQSRINRPQDPSLWWIGQSVSPRGPAGDSNADTTYPAKLATAVGYSDRITYDRPLWSGAILKGMPPLGDFCPASRVINVATGAVVYTSPGYIT